MTPASRSSLRRTLREHRRALTGPERTQREASIITALRQAFRHCPALRGTRNIALYWPADGEVDLRPLMSGLASRRSVHLPILARGNRLRFAAWRPGSIMRLNRLRIPEPRQARAEQRRAGQLDLILTPLVGFDARGNRLGMGGGFYDRSLAFRLARRRWRKPLLIGVAFELQRCPALPAEPWDVPLDGIVTEDGVRLFDRIF